MRWAVVAFVLLSIGCTRSHTVTKVKNAADVSLAFQRIGSASVEPVTASAADVNLRLSAIDVDEDGYLQREDGVLRIACRHCVDGTLTLLDDARLVSPVDQSVEQTLSESRRAGRVQLPFEYQVSSAIQIYPLVRTPVSNVEYFQQTTEPVSELGWLLVPGAVLTVVGLVVIPQDAVAGMLMFVPGLALDVVGGLHLALPRDVQRFDARGRPIAMTEPVQAPARAVPGAAAGTDDAATTDDDGTVDDPGLDE